MGLDIKCLPNIDRNATYKLGNKGIAIKLTFRCEAGFSCISFKSKGHYYYTKCILVPYQDNMPQAIWDGYYLLKATMLKEINGYHINKLLTIEEKYNSFINTNREVQLTFDF